MAMEDCFHRDWEGNMVVSKVSFGSCKRRTLPPEVVRQGATILFKALSRSDRYENIAEIVELYPGCATLTRNGVFPLSHAVTKDYYRAEKNHVTLKFLLRQHEEALHEEVMHDGCDRPFLHHVLRQFKNSNAQNDLKLVKHLLQRLPLRTDKGVPLIYNKEPETGFTLLHVAASCCTSAIVTEVLFACPDALKELDWNGKSPLDHILIRSDSSRAILIEASFHIAPGVSRLLDAAGRTPLHRLLYSCTTGLQDSIPLLTREAPEALFLADFSGNIPLDVAIMASVEDVNILRLLVPPTEQLLHFMCRHSCFCSLRLLERILNADSEAICTKDTHGDLPLHSVFKNCHPLAIEGIDYLIRKWPDALTMPNGSGHSPLQLALAAGWTRDLIVRTADAGAEVQEGWMPRLEGNYLFL